MSVCYAQQKIRNEQIVENCHKSRMFIRWFSPTMVTIKKNVKKCQANCTKNIKLWPCRQQNMKGYLWVLFLMPLASCFFTYNVCKVRFQLVTRDSKLLTHIGANPTNLSSPVLSMEIIDMCVHIRSLTSQAIYYDHM